MSIFGIYFPLWSIIVTVVFAGIYVLFTILGKLRIKKQKSKRVTLEAKNNANDI